MLKIRRPLGRLIFNMGIAIPGKTVFLIETAPDQNKNAYLKSVYLVNDIYITWLWLMNIQEWFNMLCNWHLISPDSYLQLVYRNTVPNGHNINNSCRCANDTRISYQTVPTKRRQGPLLLITAWISIYIHYKVWEEITYPILNFNGATVEA